MNTMLRGLFITTLLLLSQVSYARISLIPEKKKPSDSIIQMQQRNDAEMFNGTLQLPNSGFEDWINEGNDNIEPVAWHSFMTGNASGMTELGKSRRLEKSSDTRPGSKGSYSVKIFSTETIGIIANGNLTTGRINLGSTKPTDKSNYNFTDRGSSHACAFTAKPDSLVVWIKFTPNGGNGPASIVAVLHGDFNTHDPYGNNSEIVGKSTILSANTQGEWVRCSQPFVYGGEFGSNDPRYMLVSFTTNATPGGGNKNDYLWIDDIYCVYNPTLLTLPLNQLSYPLTSQSATPIEIPFSIQGSMSPNNLQSPNKVIAELSDAEGSFDNPIVLGERTTDVSGVISGEIPASTPTGTKYRVRVRSTNYPLTAKDNGENLELYRGYEVNATAFENRGSVSGNIGTFKENASISLTATAHTGNHFVHWKENGQVVSTDNPYSFTLTANRNLLAVFDTNRYQLDLSIEGNGKLNMESCSLIHNQKVELTATAGEGQNFVGYYEDNILVQSNPTYTFNILKNRSLVARFSTEKFLLSIKSNNLTFGRVTGGGSYDYNSNVQVVATPNEHCRFVAWLDAEGDTLSKSATYSFSIKSSTLLKAIFAEIEHRVSCDIQPSQAGKVIGTGTYSQLVPFQTVLLEAQANPGYEFVEWESTGESASILQDNPLTVIDNRRVTQDYHYIARFKLLTYPLTLGNIPIDGGNCTGAGEYAMGETVGVQAIPAEGYLFKGWMQDGKTDTISRENPYSFKINGATHLTAVYKKEQFQLTIENATPEMGSVEGEGIYEYNTLATLKASPASPKFEFRAWMKGKDTLSKSKIFEYIVTSSTEITALFSIKRKQIQVGISPAKGGSVQGAGLYEHLTTVQLAAVSNTGYSFKHWQDQQGNILSLSSGFFVLANRDTNITAVFQPDLHQIDLTTSEFGEISFDDRNWSQTISKEYPYDSGITLYARSKTEGYKFIKWNYSDARPSNNENPCHLTVQKDLQISAEFSDKTYTALAEVIPANSGAVKNAGNYEKGELVILEAVAKKGFVFDKWTDTKGETLSQDPTFGFFIVQDTSVQAHFKDLSWKVRTSVLPENSGYITAPEKITFKQELVLNAEAVEGYEFSHWQDAGNQNHLSDQAVFTTFPEEDVFYQAVFHKKKYRLTLTSSDPTAGNITESGKGEYEHGSLVEIHARPQPGYSFIKFINDGVEYTQNPFYLTMEKEEEIQAIFQENEYTITTHCDSDMGTAEIKTTHSVLHYGDSVFLSAHPKDHYVFKHWIGSQGIYSKTPELLILCTENLHLEAIFELQKFEIKAESASISMGYTMVDGGNRQPYGSRVLIEAVPVFGYKFKHWTTADSSQVLSPYPVFYVTATQDTHCLAIFETDSMRLTTSVNNPLYGQIIQGGNYPFGTEVPVSVQPFYGYEFSHYEIEDQIVSTHPDYTVVMEKETHLKAVFQPKKMNIRIESNVSDPGELIGSGVYEYLQQIVIEARPSASYKFKEWRNAEKSIGKNAQKTICVTQDSVLYAILEKDSVTLTLKSSVEGRAEGGGNYAMYSSVTVQAIPSAGYKFSAWMNENEEVVSTQETHSFIIEKSMTLQAKFQPIFFAIKTSVNDSLGGKVIGEGTYSYNSQCQLLATTFDNYEFKRWKLVGASAVDPELDTLFSESELSYPTLFYTTRKALDIEAEFQKKTFTIEAVANPMEGGSINNTGSYMYGSVTSLQAVANPHYEFASWWLDGQEIGNDPLLEIEVTQDRSYVAKFVKKKYALTLSSFPENCGVLIGEGNYTYGDTAKISISTFPGYVFEEWLDKNFKVVSKNSSFDYVVTENSYLTASVIDKTANEENETADLPGIYPNPVSSHFFIDHAALQRLRIFNLSGVLIYESEVRSLPHRVDFSQVSKGFYILELHLTDKTVLHCKIGKL